MFKLFLALIVLTVPETAFANCSSPSGTASQTRYDFTGNKMYYCDNTNWVAMGASAASIAPKIRQQVPSFPLAPDGNDWADAIVCPHTAIGAVVFTLSYYAGAAIGVLYNYAGGEGVYYSTLGARGSTNDAGNYCPTTYAAATKIYYGQ